MHHRRGHEGDGMLAKALRIALFDLDQFMIVDPETKLPHQHERLLRADHLDFWPAQQDFLDGRAVVRLHMIDQQIIERAAAEQVLDIFKELAAGRPIDGVKKHGAFVEQQIGVI